MDRPPFGNAWGWLKICAQIREGMSPDDAINQYMGFSRLWSPTTVYAAQHELCPNTLPPS
jgi:hypothetical protein